LFTCNIIPTGTVEAVVWMADKAVFTFLVADHLKIYFAWVISSEVRFEINDLMIVNIETILQ
jgi:hypothetical protein